MLRILNITFTTRWGGLEQAFLNYIEILKEITVIPVVHRNSSILPFLKGKFYKLTNFSKYDPITYFTLKRIITKEKPDLIITHGNRAHHLSKLVAKNIPVIGVAHGYGFNHITKCDYIFSVSDDIKNALIKINYPALQIYHIPNVIKIDPAIQHIVPKEFLIPIIGVISRIEKEKNIDVFIKAVNILKNKNIKFKALIAGIGSELENIRRLIKELSLEQEIELIGFITDTTKFYQNIDILCVPSQYEPFGIVILEGFLFSKPVIASDATGPLEIIEDKIDGFIVKKGDPNELASTIRYLIENPSIIPNITKKAFKKLNLYDMTKVGVEIIKILEKIKKI